MKSSEWPFSRFLVYDSCATPAPAPISKVMILQDPRGLPARAGSATCGPRHASAGCGVEFLLTQLARLLPWLVAFGVEQAAPKHLRWPSVEDRVGAVRQLGRKLVFSADRMRCAPFYILPHEGVLRVEMFQTHPLARAPFFEDSLCNLEPVCSRRSSAVWAPFNVALHGLQSRLARVFPLRTLQHPPSVGV